MSIVSFDVNAHKHEQDYFREQAKQLALQLFSNENFLWVAIQNFRSQEDKKLKNLNASTSKAILALASILPPPQILWQEFAETLEYPMSRRLEEIKHLENDLLQATEATPVDEELKARIQLELEVKTIELNLYILKKENQKEQLLELISASLQNKDKQRQMEQTLNKIEQSKNRAKKYTKLQSRAEAALEITGWIGNGPFPFNPFGQILAPLPLFIARFAFTISNRSNPSKMPPKFSQKLDTMGVIAGVGGIVATVLATASMPLLPVIAAGAILINNITSTVVAVKKYKASKAIIETPAGKKIRRKGHFADIFGNIAGTVASTGALGIAFAITLAVSTVAFPPVALALLGTIGLGIAIAGFTVSAMAYFKKKDLLEEANNQKIVFDFKNACEHGVLDDASLSFDDKKIRSLALKNPPSEPINLLAAVTRSTDPKEQMVKPLDEEKIVKQFSRVLALGFIPNLIDSSHKNFSLTPKTYIIQIPEHEPPSRSAAREAILKIGGIPHDHTEQIKILPSPRPEDPITLSTKIIEPEQKPFVGFSNTDPTQENRHTDKPAPKAQSPAPTPPIIKL